MNDIDIKKLIILNLPFVLFFYLANKAAQGFRLAEGADLGTRIFNLNTGFAAAFSNPMPSLYHLDLLAGVVGTALMALMLHMKKQNAKKFRKHRHTGHAKAYHYAVKTAAASSQTAYHSLHRKR